MRLYIPGDGEREKCLRECALSRGHTLSGDRFDAAVMKMPYTSYEQAVCERMKEGCWVVCGKCDDCFLRTAREKHWQLCPALEDEAYTLKNAALTAEGAICAAMEKTDRALMDSRCLVIGYGRIGKSLTEKLRGLGASVHVAARRQESREEAGEGSLDIPGISNVIFRYDMIFNTVPFPVLTREILQNGRKDTLYLELASVPYGIDLDAARGMGLKVSLESGVPGRYCPRSAAGNLMDYIERSVQENE